jgi:hypothetical protein
LVACAILLASVLTGAAAARPARSSREVGYWQYGYVISQGTGLAGADTVERAFVITSQTFGYCASRNRNRRLVADATPFIQQQLRTAFGQRASINELRVMAQTTEAQARHSRAAARAGSGRIMDFLLQVVDDRSSCVVPRGSAN